MSQRDETQAFDDLLAHLRQTRGFDFTGYKRQSLQRRVSKHMRTHSIETFSNYLDYLEVHPEEFQSLFNTILINVTAFFRDMPAWKYLWEERLPALIATIPPEEPIRIWSAGCSSGEEAYTLAMILAELLAPSDFRTRVKIYATDVDEEALAEARRANYSLRDLEAIPEALRDKYFEPAAGRRYVFQKDLRRSVIFGRHDLVQDAPISRLDLLVCRNALMYLNAETQGRIVSRLHFALRPSGLLFLGKAEMLLSHGNLFSPVNLPYRIFEKVPGNTLRDRTFTFTTPNAKNKETQQTPQGLLREAAFDAIALAHIVVDLDGMLAIANHQACTLFNLEQKDLGNPFHDLEISYRPLELRARIQKVYSDKAPLFIQDVEHHPGEDLLQFFDVQLVPLKGKDDSIIGVGITFDEVTHRHQLQTRLEDYEQNLETANEELQSANEELETTNEELQSTNEELETTNEELQSTNEELETMNEELQSANAELQTINDELQLRTEESNQANAYLSSVLTSINSGVVVLDRQCNILTWNQASANLWGLRFDEVRGRSFWDLDIGLPVEELRKTLQDCLNGKDRIELLQLASVNRRGRSFPCRITCTPLIGADGNRQGVILLMEAIAP